MTDSKTMNERSIRFYLQTSPGFLGKKKGSERFKVIIDGEIQKVYGVGENGGSREQVQFDNPLCFDYELLKSKFDLNLETSLADSNTDDEEINEGALPFPPPEKNN